MIYDTFRQLSAMLGELSDNLIDKDYNAELKALGKANDSSAAARLQLEVKYNRLWEDELNAIYKKLQTKISQKEQMQLIESQEGWLQYFTKESAFVNQAFFLSQSDPLISSQGKVQMEEANRARLRARTLELMEYYLMLGNQVEFVYKGTEG